MKNRKIKKVFSRFPLVALTIILLFLLFFTAILSGVLVVNGLLIYAFPDMERYILWAFNFLSWLIVVITVQHAANRDMVPETKIPWIICIIALNLFGVAIYATFSSNKLSAKTRKLHERLRRETAAFEERTLTKEAVRLELGNWEAVSESLSTVNPSAVLHGGTKTEYFASGEEMMPSLLADLERAEHYIFIEYFIIETGIFWDSVLGILERKVQEGVEVRVMYDDIGSMGKVRFNYYKKLQRKGIDCVKFNPFVPVVTNVHNCRDHRKIVVIDGKVGYTGGLNLADEYINEIHPFGYWKDTAVRLEGMGVKNLLMTFLRLFNMQKKRTEDVSRYLPEKYEFAAGEGYVQPYGDGPYPLYERHLGEDVYINMLGCARRYVWITTPYLIIDYRMREELILAARRGVDVRILTPHIPDKKLAFSLTRSNYMALIKGGVKIYEYTPGFVHAKMCLSDDEAAVIGTINLDYRSFLYHFENAVFMYRTKAIQAMKADMVSVFAVSRLQTEEDAKKNVVWRWLCELAKLFAPLF